MLIDPLLRLPQPGQAFTHYKGGTYRVIAVGRLSERRDCLMVVYASDRRGEVWIRPLGMFTEQVGYWPDGKRRPRFTSTSDLSEDDLAACRVAAANDGIWSDWFE